MVKMIPLGGRHGQARFALVDDEDFTEVSSRRWYLDEHGYARRRTGQFEVPARRLVYMHRELVGSPKGLAVDHANGDTLDNRKRNLRVLPRRALNQANQAKNHKASGGTSSVFKGVTRNIKNRCWTAQMMCNYKHHYLGSFVLEEEAARAYDAAAREAFGEYARLNFPELGERGLDGSLVG